MEKALAGYRVLDLTHVQSGPTCTQLMGFLGADVIKVEPPSGDVTRGQLRDIPEADSLYFTMLNCNKRSVVIDLKQERGKEVFSDLLRKADILIENFGKGTLDRLGFTWETVHKINPRVILASIKGYGSTGPYSDFPAYEMAVQAMGGNMGVTGFADGPPIVSHAAIADAGSGVNMLAGILAALLQRERTGKGQRVEVAMMDVAVGWIRTKLRDQQRPGFEEPKRTGNDSGGGQPGYLVKCKPGGLNDYIFIYTSNRRDVWEALCRHMAREDWIADPKFCHPQTALRTARGNFRRHRGMGQGLHQMGIDGDTVRYRRAGRPGTQYQGNPRRQTPAPTADHRRRQAAHTRVIQKRRLSDQAFRLAGRSDQRACIGPAYQ